MKTLIQVRLLSYAGSSDHIRLWTELWMNVGLWLSIHPSEIMKMELLLLFYIILLNLLYIVYISILLSVSLWMIADGTFLKSHAIISFAPLWRKHTAEKKWKQDGVWLQGNVTPSLRRRLGARNDSPHQGIRSVLWLRLMCPHKGSRKHRWEPGAGLTFKDLGIVICFCQPGFLFLRPYSLKHRPTYWGLIFKLGA